MHSLEVLKGQNLDATARELAHAIVDNDEQCANDIVESVWADRWAGRITEDEALSVFTRARRHERSEDPGWNPGEMEEHNG